MGENRVILRAMTTESELRETMAEHDRARRGKIKGGVYLAAIFLGLCVLKAWLGSGQDDEFGNPGDQMTLLQAARFVWRIIGDAALGLGIIVGVAWVWNTAKSKLKKRT